MPTIHCRKAVGSLLVALMAATPIASQASSESDERALKLDQSIQAFKDEVLDFSREAQNIEDDVMYPAHTRVSVYLGVKIPGLLLKEVSVAIDQAPPQIITYTDRDARAMLADRHLQRILLGSIQPGGHRIRVKYSGQMMDAKENAPPVGDSFEAVFDKDSRETELEISISRPNRLAKAGISMTQWRAKK